MTSLRLPIGPITLSAVADSVTINLPAIALAPLAGHTISAITLEADGGPTPPTPPPRTLWNSPTLDTILDNDWDPRDYRDAWTDDNRVQVDTEDDANLIASLTTNGAHAPVLDIDYPARLVPSSTPGHYHLYLDREIPWHRYQLALWALSVAGLIEPGFARAAAARKMTFARTRPTKPPTQQTDAPTTITEGRILSAGFTPHPLPGCTVEVVDPPPADLIADPLLASPDPLSYGFRQRPKT